MKGSHTKGYLCLRIVREKVSSILCFTICINTWQARNTCLQKKAVNLMKIYWVVYTKWLLLNFIIWNWIYMLYNSHIHSIAASLRFNTYSEMQTILFFKVIKKMIEHINSLLIRCKSQMTGKAQWNSLLNIKKTGNLRYAFSWQESCRNLSLQ